MWLDFILYFCFVGANIDTSSTIVLPSASTFLFVSTEWWMRLQRCCRVSSSNSDQSLFSFFSGIDWYRVGCWTVLRLLYSTCFLFSPQSSSHLHSPFNLRQWFLCCVMFVSPLSSLIMRLIGPCVDARLVRHHRFFPANAPYAEKVIPSLILPSPYIFQNEFDCWRRATNGRTRPENMLLRTRETLTDGQLCRSLISVGWKADLGGTWICSSWNGWRARWPCIARRNQKSLDTTSGRCSLGRWRKGRPYPWLNDG